MWLCSSLLHISIDVRRISIGQECRSRDEWARLHGDLIPRLEMLASRVPSLASLTLCFTLHPIEARYLFIKPQKQPWARYVQKTLARKVYFHLSVEDPSPSLIWNVRGRNWMTYVLSHYIKVGSKALEDILMPMSLRCSDDGYVGLEKLFDSDI